MYYSIFKDNLFVCKLFLIKRKCLAILSEPFSFFLFLLCFRQGRYWLVFLSEVLYFVDINFRSKEWKLCFKGLKGYVTSSKFEDTMKAFSLWFSRLHVEACQGIIGLSVLNHAVTMEFQTWKRELSPSWREGCNCYSSFLLLRQSPSLITIELSCTWAVLLYGNTVWNCIDLHFSL